MGASRRTRRRKGIRDRERRFTEKGIFFQKTRFAIAKMAKNACFACVIAPEENSTKNALLLWLWPFGRIAAF